MAQEIDQMCLDNLDEFVNDENKLVTYKWLSRTLSLHINQAKQILHTFVSEQRNKKDNDSLCLTYFLAGLVKDKNGDQMTYKVEVVPEEMLESSKSTLDVVTSCHIYSVKKGKLKDTNALYTADYDLLKAHILESNKHSAVECSAAKLISEEEMYTKRKISKPTPVSQQNGSHVSKTPATSKPVSSKSTEKVSPKGKKVAGIAGMFAKSSSKSTDSSKDKEEESSNSKTEVKPSSKTKTKPKQGAVTNFFSKQAAKPKTEVKLEDSPIIEPTKKASPVKGKYSSETETSHEKVKTTEEAKPLKSEKPKQKTSSGKKKKAEVDEEDPTQQQKKRRRIRQISDSSEEEMDVEIESPIPSPAAPESDPEEIPPTPSPKKPSPVPSPAKTSPVKMEEDHNDRSGQVKKRKLVSKTSINQEGFMVTEKVWETEWEDIPATKKPANESKPSTTVKKSSPPAKKMSPVKQSGKQTNMMSFFKKK